jgi:hypothetical protein
MIENIQQHEQRLRELNDKFMRREISSAEVKEEISKLLGDTEEDKAKEVLDAEINAKISMKARERLTVEQYFLKREKIRAEILGRPQKAVLDEFIEECRQTGSECIFCHNKDVKSFGSFWKCNNCKRCFRKHLRG